MIDIAIIASTSHLADLSALGSIDMALTHLVLTNAATISSSAATTPRTRSGTPHTTFRPIRSPAAPPAI